MNPTDMIMPRPFATNLRGKNDKVWYNIGRRIIVKKTIKVVINKCFGGFGLSHKAIRRYAKLAGIKLYPFIEKRNKNDNLDWHHFLPFTNKLRLECILKDKHYMPIHYATEPLNKDGTYINDAYWSPYDLKRDDPILVQVVEELGKEANGEHAELEVVSIPGNVKWHIDEYDGTESIHEDHRNWG